MSEVAVMVPVIRREPRTAPHMGRLSQAMRCYMKTNTGKIAAVATAVSLGLIVASVIDPTAAWDIRTFRLGLAGAFISCTTWVLAHTQITAQMVEIARQQGWDDGYENGLADGRSENNVLRLERWAPSQCSPVADDGPAEEFGQQLHVAGAPDGVV